MERGALYGVVIGCVVILGAWLPPRLRRLPLSWPMLCVALGAVAETCGVLHVPLSLLRDSAMPKLALEAAITLALMSAGLKLDRPLSWRGWSTTWRLLALAMPVTGLALALCAQRMLAVPWPLAWTLSAMLVPTDPVLASQVEVGPPNRGEEGEVRFALTSEAGLNDGLALPFVLGGLAAMQADTPDLQGWGRLVVQTIGGVGLGWAEGLLFGRLLFRTRVGLSESGTGFAALGIAIVNYYLAELFSCNGFIAVFISALALRATAPAHDFHTEMSSVADTSVHLLTIMVLIAFGAFVTGHLIWNCRLSDVGLAGLLLLGLRPVLTYLCLYGSSHPPVSRILTAFFGVRGLGSLYYVVFAIRETVDSHDERLACVVGAVVLGSVVLHGLTASPLLAYADRKRAAYARQTETP